MPTENGNTGHETLSIHLGQDNTREQRAPALIQDNLGDTLLAQGNPADALNAYRAALAIRERAATADPADMSLQRDITVTHIKIGDALSAKRHFGALKAYRDALAIIKRLTAADPTNAGWQRDLAVSHLKIGDTHLAQNNPVGALKAYRESRAISERLASADPDNMGAQYDLSLALVRTAGILRTRRDTADALNAYRDALALSKRVIAADPRNAGAQRNIAFIHIGMAQIAIKNKSSGMVSLAKARMRMFAMKRRGMLTPSDEICLTGQLDSIAHSQERREEGEGWHESGEGYADPGDSGAGDGGDGE